MGSTKIGNPYRKEIRMEYSRLPDSFSVIDSTSDIFEGDILYPFAIDEILCRQVGEGKKGPSMHIWRHHKAFVLGLRDRKLPYSLEAMDWLEDQGYRVTVRNSGGAAVPLDPGVINLSIILPNHDQRMDFHQDFEIMYEVIKNSLRSSDSVNKGEILGAYCPGDFDLSIAGKKFCGIAQRRQTKAFVIQAFIVVQGNGKENAELVKEFYQLASGGSPNPNHPIVTPQSMASLQEVGAVPSVEQYRLDLIASLTENGGKMESARPLFRSLKEEIEETIVQLRSRYEKRE
jgi:octanoyl-[GcvH]:protein N-octanoyltransferase